MLYVTYRSLETTVKSMLAVKQITEQTANAVFEVAEEFQLGECNWAALRDIIRLKVDDAEKVIAAIETDATVNEFQYKQGEPETAKGKIE